MRRKRPQLQYHAIKNLRPEHKKDIEAAFDILFEETLRRYPDSLGDPRVDASADTASQQGDATM